MHFCCSRLAAPFRAFYLDCTECLKPQFQLSVSDSHGGEYGEKSPDGRRFIKSKELSEAFEQTEAYSNLYVELATDSDSAAKFVNGIIPADLVKQMNSPEARRARKELEDRLPDSITTEPQA